MGGELNQGAAELSMEQIDRVIDLCLKSKCRRVYITGGEPFLAANIWYLLERCGKNGITVEEITTNGTFLGVLDERKTELINNSVVNLAISLDSPNEYEHDNSRGVEGTYRKIQDFLLDDEKRRFFKSSFSFNVVLHGRNISEIKAIIDLAAAWKVRHINFQPLSPESIFPDMHLVKNKREYVSNLDLDAFKSQVEMLINHSKRNCITTDLPVFKLWAPLYFKYLYSDRYFFEIFPTKFLCSKVFNYVHINYFGDLISCANSKPFTNIANVDCFYKWRLNGQKLKKMFRDKKYFGYCRFCFCDFPTSMRISLLYYPFNNLFYLLALVMYYFFRLRAKRF
jgi:MoaA/NifB/PqqE/SkfB family radical SAM enzyme